VGGIDPLFLELQSAVAGRYSLERELGRGGMGVVYLARDVALDRPVALKLFPPELAARPALRERFLREARTAARLSHPNIVPIHAVEESGRLVWFVMAFVPGESLGARLRERGSLPPAEIARILRDVAWALGYAHGQGVVHRDVKPDNILLEAGGRRALIADFGIAAPVEAQGDSAGGVLGTVAYLSPEQASGERVDGRSDLYALGVVGYFALACRLPYPVTRLTDLIQRQLAAPPPALATVAPHAPRALCRAIDRALAPIATARFQTGEDLANALDQLGTSSTELPAPFRVWIQKGKQRRNPVMLLLLLWGLPSLLGIVFAVAGGDEFGAATAMFLWLVLLVTVPAAVALSARLLHTRKLLAAGYSRADLILALEQHVEQRREELAFEHGSTPSRVGTMVNGAILLALASGVGALITGAALGYPAAGPLITTGAIALVGALLLGALRNVVPGARAGARDRWAEFALQFWKGRVGRWLIRLAGWRLRDRTAPEQLVHRPTELALGDAAEALFRALPEAERRDLKLLPEQIRHLADQAQIMRRRIEELDDLILRAAPDTLFGEGRTHTGDGGATELSSARDLWASRLRETVTLLESIRVGLLKLHAGSAAPETLTADLEAARELKERLGLLLHGHAETDRLLGRMPP
jgi:serine/threonine-protein kinase